MTYGVDPKLWRMMSMSERARAAIQWGQRTADKEYREWRESVLRDIKAEQERARVEDLAKIGVYEVKTHNP